MTEITSGRYDILLDKGTLDAIATEGAAGTGSQQVNTIRWYTLITVPTRTTLGFVLICHATVGQSDQPVQSHLLHCFGYL